MPPTEPCRIVSATGYRVYLPDTGHTAFSFVQLTRPNRLQGHPTQSTQLCIDSGAGRQLVSTRYGFNLMVTKSTDQVPATQYLLYSASPQPVT